MTQVTTTTGTTGTSSTPPTNPMATLGKDDFLQLLVTQLKYQDPMQPTDNSQFMAQMAQFSTVEGITNLESTLTTLQGVGLIGKQITYTAGDGSTKSDVATSVAMKDGSYTVTVGNDTISPSQILSVADPSASGSTTPATTTPTTTTTGATGA
jgi:flagellar basal-body rod modification protein FlgD